MRLYTKVKLDDIKIMDVYSSVKPNEKKIEKYREIYKKHHAFKNLPVLNSDLVLVDGYITYLLMKEANLSDVVVIVNTDIVYDYAKDTMYIYGIHPSDVKNREYVWKVSKSEEWKDFRENIQVGDIIKCNTSLGKQFVKVTKIVMSEKSPRRYIKQVTIPIIYKEIDTTENI